MNAPFQPKRINVPGVLSDEAVQEQLKQFASAKNVDAAAAPAPNSAVEFTDRIQREYLSKPTNLARVAPAALPGPLGTLAGGLASSTAMSPPQRDPQAEAIDVRSDILSEAAASIPDPIRNFVLGPVVGLLGEGGAVARLGTLDSPEARQAEAERRAVDMAAAEKAVKSKAEIREQLRNMSDEDAAQLGLPVAPGGVDEAVKEEAAARDQEVMQKASERRKEAAAAVTDPNKQPTQTWWLNALQSGARGAASVPVSALKAPAIAWELTAGRVLAAGDIQKSNMRAWVDTLDQSLNKMLPGDKARAQDIATQLSQGVGSMLAFMVAGYAGAAAGLPAGTATTMMGAASGATSQYEDAERFNAVGLQKYMAFVLGGAIGATEAIPIDRMLFRADNATGGLVRRMLTNTAAGSIEEFVQELGQAVGTDVVAKYVYDAGRDFDVQSYLKQALIGAATGGMAGAAITALHEAGVTGRPADPEQQVPPAERESMVTQVIDSIQQEIDAIPGLADAVEQAGASEVLAEVVPSSDGRRSLTEGGSTLDISETRDLIEVEDLSTPPDERGKGQARRLMENLVSEADATHRPVRLMALPDEGTDKRRLVDFYRSLGFRETGEVDDGGIMMERAPRSTVKGPGGSIPVADNGQMQIHHWSRKALDVIDPAMRGTGPIRGVERSRLVGEDAVDRSYFGVGDPDFPRKLAETNKTLPPRKRAFMQRTDPYHGEGLGNIRHTVEVDPTTMYNWFEDPLNLRGQLDRSTPATEQVTRYERLIKDAGFAGVYFSESPLGQTAVLFNPSKPTRVEDERFGLPIDEIAQPQDFANPTPETFQKGGWAVLTATQEAQGDAFSEANVAANEKLRTELRKKGVRFEEVGGTYQGVDQGPSFLVFMPEKDALKLGQKYKQESVLTRRGLEYGDGRLVPALPEQTVVGDKAKKNDFFSTLPSGQAFSIGLDFGSQVAGDMPDVLAKIGEPARVKKLADQVPGLKGVMKYMTPDEQAKLTARSAAKIVEVFSNLPDPKEMAAVAFSGRAKRGWYQRSAEALVDIFGLQDAPRFAGLLAALSPQTSVENNAVNALTTWVNWVKAGRPTGRKQIVAILGQSVQGNKGENSVLPAWINNSVEALTNPDAMAITLSGPKVDSFMRNLQGRVVEVTNDAWMANFANVEQTLFAKSGAAPGKSPGYVGMSAVVRQAADVASKLTGETWTPAEIQETVWSWAKTLYEKAGAAGENRTAEQIMAAGGVTAEEISATPDFASLFVGGVYRQLLEKGGYDVAKVASRSRPADAKPAGGGQPNVAEGSGIAQRTFERHLQRAARRLDALRERRAQADRGETFSLDETFFPETGQVTEQQFLPDDAEDLFASTAGARGPYNAEPQRPDAGIASTPGAEVGDESLSKISRNFVNLLDLTVRQGRLTLKGGDVMGEFNRKTQVTRLRTANDFSTLTHEAGHQLYFSAGDSLKMFIGGNQQPLMDVATRLYGGDTATMPKAQHAAEGFAEFFRVYVTNPKFARREYPGLTAEFEEVLDKDAPNLRAGLEKVSQQFGAWLQLPSSQMVRNMIVSGKKDEGLGAALKELREAGFGTWMQEIARKRITESVNRYAGLNSLISQTLNKGQETKGKAIDLKRADDPRTLVRLAQNAGARAMVQTTDGVMNHHSVQPMTRGLRDALLLSQGRRVDQNLSKIDPVRQQDFAAFLVALRGIDEYRRLDEGKIERPPLAATLGDLQVTVQELSKKYPEFVEAAKVVNEYGMGLWKKAYAAGLMTRETYQDGLDRQFYAPLQRDMSDKKASLGASALTGGSKLVKRFRGSDRDIIDPMDVLLHKTFALEQIIAKNDAIKAMALLADRSGKAGSLIERVPAQQLIGKQYSVQEVARQLTKDDTLTQTDAADLMTILEASIEDGNVISMFRSEQASTKGENIVFFWEDGRLAALQLADGDLGADVVNTMNGVGRENLPLFTDLIASTSTAFRAAITSWPDFLLVNFIRDQMSAFILAGTGYKPFASGLRGVYDELRQKQWAKQYNAAMGIMGGMNVAALHDARINRDIAALKKKGYFAKAFNEGGVRGAISGLSKIIELTETGTRLGIFRGAYERAKKDGLSDWEASIEASYTATDYIDFGLNGSRMTFFRRTIPFLNAQLQGLYKMMRTLGADEVRQRKGLNFALRAYFKNVNNLDLSRTEKQALRTGRQAWIKMSSLGLISAALHFLFEDDPDYQEAGEYMRTTGWVIPMGDGRIFYIPKPFELALVANFVERGLESANGDESAKDRFMRGLALTMLPPTSPPAIQIAVELAANKDFFTGQEIVPDYMRALAPELQFNNYTSELAKQIGETMGWSPMIVDHVLSGLGASAYRDLTTMYNTTDPSRPELDATDAPILRRFVRDARRGSASSRDFWATASTVDGTLRRAEVSYRSYLEGGNENAANEYLSTLDEDERAYALLNVHFKADAKRLNPFYRARQLTTIVSALRREMVSDLGVEDTTTKTSSEIKLTAKEKSQLDEVLSEFARREMRNTLIAMGAPGWQSKRQIDTASTLDLMTAIEPRMREEFDRRVKKAKVYDFRTVTDYWPEVKDRLLRDRENTFLKDIVTLAKVMR